MNRQETALKVLERIDSLVTDENYQLGIQGEEILLLAKAFAFLRSPAAQGGDS